MADYVGVKIEIADPHRKGIINDHIEVTDVSHPKKYYVYYRANYNIGNGPEPLGEKCAYAGSSKRGWEKTKTLCENVSLEKAMETGKAKAKELGVLLFRYIPGTGDVVEWHPKDWIPKIG